MSDNLLLFLLALELLRLDRESVQILAPKSERSICLRTGGSQSIENMSYETSVLRIFGRKSLFLHQP